MSSLFTSDGSFPLQFAIIFVVIFVVLATIAYAFRRITGRGLSLSSKAGQRGRQPRLGIIDVYELDRQRQLILLRRDNVEHLLLVGGPNDVVVERNITRGSARVALDEPSRQEPAFEPDSELAAPEVERPREPLMTHEEASPPVAAPSPAAPALAPSAARMVDRLAERHADETALFEAATAPARRPEPAPARGVRRSPPSLVNYKPEGQDERSRPAHPPLTAREPVAPEPAAPEPVVPEPQRVVEPPQAAALPPPPLATVAPRAIDAAILSDMARQLEEALKRPTADAPPLPPPPPQAAPVDETQEPAPAPPAPAVTPPPMAMIPPEADEAPAPDRPVDPMAAAMAASPQEPAVDDLFEDRASPEPVAPEPAAASFLPEPPPAPAPAPAPAPKAATQNPFSVEEIEAEFARLLGRPLDRKS